MPEPDEQEQQRRAALIATLPDASITGYIYNDQTAIEDELGIPRQSPN